MVSRLFDSLPTKMDFLLVGHHSTKTESLLGSLHRREVTKRGKEYLFLTRRNRYHRIVDKDALLFGLSLRIDLGLKESQ